MQGVSSMLDAMCKGSSVREGDQVASAIVHGSDRLQTYNIHTPTGRAHGPTNVCTHGEASNPVNMGAEAHGIA